MYVAIFFLPVSCCIFDYKMGSMNLWHVRGKLVGVETLCTTCRLERRKDKICMFVILTRLPCMIDVLDEKIVENESP